MKAAFYEINTNTKEGMFLNGFGSRNKGAAGTQDPIFIRIMLIEDKNKNKLLTITADILWFHQDLSNRLRVFAEDQYKIPRSSIIINSSHTHRGPLIHPDPVYPHWPIDIKYSENFEKLIYQGIDNVVKNLKPSSIKFANLKSNFGINRRLPIAGTDKIDRDIRPNENGYYDPDLPVIAVFSEKKLQGVFYSYAAHPSENGGYTFSANYPGVISRYLKKVLGDQVATVFAQGAGGDIKPRFYEKKAARFKSPTAEEKELLCSEVAQTIIAALESDEFKEIELDISSKEKEFPIPFDLTKMLTNKELQKISMTTKNILGTALTDRIWAKKILEDQLYNAVEKERNQYVSLINLNKEISIIAMSGEVVSSIGRMAKDLFPNKKIIFLGYCNHVNAYIPSAKMIDEGGYESVDCISEYLKPAPFSKKIDSIIMDSIKDLEWSQR